MLCLMVPTGNRPALALVPPLAEDAGPSGEARFATAVAEALATTPASAGCDESLTLHLFASAALAFNKLDLDAACCASLALRAAVLTVAGITPSTEPVPLVVRDLRQGLVNLLDYLQDLVTAVVSRSAGVDRSVLLERAIELLAC